MKIGIICAMGLEECEALLVYDLLYRAKLDVKLIGLEKQIESSHKIVFNTDMTIDEFDYQDYDCLILPGGMPGTLNLEANQTVQKIIDYFVDNNKLIAAICAAPSILNHKGLLKEEKFSCYPGFECGLKPSDKKAIREGNIITAKGLGAEFEFAYEIIKALTNEQVAKETLEKVQY